MVLNSALIIVDMQLYYLSPRSPFYRYYHALQPGCMDYIVGRCESTVLPNIARLLDHYRRAGLPVVYLRLCGTNPDRSDLHRFFREAYQQALAAGYADLYPLAHEPMAAIHPSIMQDDTDTVFDKTTFSAFTGTRIDHFLRSAGIQQLVFAGLATSQCVETTARDASDRGYQIIHIQDAQADYAETWHQASLFSSQGVCGGLIYSADEFLNSNCSETDGLITRRHCEER